MGDELFGATATLPDGGHRDRFRARGRFGGNGWADLTCTGPDARSGGRARLLAVVLSLPAAAAGSGAFSATRRRRRSAPSPASATVWPLGDLNGDTDPDAVVANYFDETETV